MLKQNQRKIIEAVKLNLENRIAPRKIKRDGIKIEKSATVWGTLGTFSSNKQTKKLNYLKFTSTFRSKQLYFINTLQYYKRNRLNTN